MTTPGSIRAVRAAGSMSRMRFTCREKSSTTPVPDRVARDRRPAAARGQRDAQRSGRPRARRGRRRCPAGTPRPAGPRGSSTRPSSTRPGGGCCRRPPRAARTAARARRRRCRARAGPLPRSRSRPPRGQSRTGNRLPRARHRGLRHRSRCARDRTERPTAVSVRSTVVGLSVFTPLIPKCPGAMSAPIATLSRALRPMDPPPNEKKMMRTFTARVAAPALLAIVALAGISGCGILSRTTTAEPAVRDETGRDHRVERGRRLLAEGGGLLQPDDDRGDRRGLLGADRPVRPAARQRGLRGDRHARRRVPGRPGRHRRGRHVLLRPVRDVRRPDLRRVDPRAARRSSRRPSPGTQGDHEIMCFISSPDGQVTGTLAGADR